MGSGPSDETYLARDKILGIAKEAKADAIHPGYGFLAENREFALVCQKEGIIFVGPSGESLETMGRKIRAKSNMTQAQISVIPGSECPMDDKEEALKAANALGYPVLIKAVAGGGGKGIRRVDRGAQLFQAMNMARTEAKAAFGNDALYFEKYIPNARHIEFQILADHYGNIIHLFDRECSIQRRYQKILEDVPHLIWTIPRGFEWRGWPSPLPSPSSTAGLARWNSLLTGRKIFTTWSSTPDSR